MIVEVKILREFLCAHGAGPETHLALDELVAHLNPPGPYIYKVGDELWHIELFRHGTVIRANGYRKTPSVLVRIKTVTGQREWETREVQEWSIELCEPYTGQQKP